MVFMIFINNNKGKKIMELLIILDGDWMNLGNFIFYAKYYANILLTTISISGNTDFIVPHTYLWILIINKFSLLFCEIIYTYLYCIGRFIMIFYRIKYSNTSNYKLKIDINRHEIYHRYLQS